MKRYKAYDPPEYYNWSLDEEVLTAFRRQLEADEERRAIIEETPPSVLIELYRGLVRARLHDIYLKRWVKNGIISKAWLATGEEAVTVGSVHALNRAGEDGDVVGPMIRNAAACIEMGIPLRQMFSIYLATAETKTRGRDLHIGDLDHGVVAPVSHVGSLQPVVVGTALAFKMRDEPRVAMTWVGDGATKTGEFHEGVNFAAANNLPAIIFIQNNQVALGTPVDEHHAGDFSQWPEAYGMAGEVVDGNNVLDVYAASRLAAGRARRGEGPTLIVAETFRMGGHATHDEAEARNIFSPEVFEHWGKRDPIGVYEAYLERLDIDLTGEGRREDLEARNRSLLEEIQEAVIEEMEEASEAALEMRGSHEPDPERLTEGIYAESSAS